MDILTSLKVPTVMVDGLSVNALVLAVLAIVMILAFLAMRGRGFLPKVSAVVLALLVSVPLTVALAEQLSHPKELSLDWVEAQGEDGLLVHAVKDEGPDRIQLWLDIDGHPRAFFLPWSEELEKSLREAAEAIQGPDGLQGDLRLRLQNSLKSDPQFFGKLWPMPPLKEEDHNEAPAPRVFAPKVVA